MFCSSFLRVGLEIHTGWWAGLEVGRFFLPILDIVSTRSGDVSVRMLRTLQLNFKRRMRKLHGLLRT